MAAQPASTNDRRVTRLSISTTTTTLTPSTKAYATPPSSQTIPSSSSTFAVAPTLVDAFASLAVEVPHPPQQQEVTLQTAEHCSQNSSQSAEHRSLTAAQLTEPRPRASTRPPRRDDEKQQDSHKSGTKVSSDSVDRLVKGIGAVQIHQPFVSRHSQTTSPPVPATPTNQKRGRSDYEQENSIEERLAKLYVGPLPPTTTLTSASASASTSTPGVTPLSTTTTVTTCTSMSHNRPAKTSSKGSERRQSQLKESGERIDIALHNMTAAHMLVGDTLFFGSHRRHDTYMQCGYAHAQDEYADMQYLSTQSTSPVRIESLQMYEKAWIESRRKHEMALIEYRRVYEKEWIESQRKHGKAWTESQRKHEKEWIEFQRKYDNARIKSQQKYEKAWIESQQMYDKAWSECRRNYEKEWLESRRKYENAWIEFQQKYEQPMIASQQKYEQASEHRKKSIQNARNKPAQQHRQLSQSHHQTSPQHKQGLEELVDKLSYPLLSKDAGTVLSSLPESESSGSREDGDKTSEDHGRRRRKRVKHDDIKKEPVDETMSDAATASASFSTTTSTASTTSNFSTSSGHTVADVTLDMQNKLNFNPTTAIFQ